MADSTVLADVVSETATKVMLDKKFFLGAAAAISVVGVFVGVLTVVSVVKEKVAEKAREAELAELADNA
jgi:hypothetical protein